LNLTLLRKRTPFTRYWPQSEIQIPFDVMRWIMSLHDLENARPVVRWWDETGVYQ
jgi:hypothetical protein